MSEFQGCEGSVLVDQNCSGYTFVVHHHSKTDVLVPFVGPVVKARAISQNSTAFCASKNEARIFTHADQHATGFHSNTAGSCDDFGQRDLNGVIGKVHAFIPRWGLKKGQLVGFVHGDVWNSLPGSDPCTSDFQGDWQVAFLERKGVPNTDSATS